MRKAFITGITGQDGSYLCDLLLEKGYDEVHGLVHRPDSLATSHLQHLLSNRLIVGKRLFLHPGSLEDAMHLRRIVHDAKPSEFYHLAGQSSPQRSMLLPESTVETVGLATVRILEIIKDLSNPPRFLYASSSEVFGQPTTPFQNENTAINPTTPYGAAKAFSQQMAKIYRSAFGLHTCSAILFNHESPRRSDAFVSLKVAKAVARIKKGLQKNVALGSLEGKRDWGWAPSYVEGMWTMLQQEKADDFVFATGQLHSVQDLVRIAFSSVGLDWEEHVTYDESLAGPDHTTPRCGDATKAKSLLRWENTVPFSEIVAHMVELELANIQ